MNFFSDSTRNIHITTKTNADGRFTIPPENLPIGRYIVYLAPNRTDIPKVYQSLMDSPLVLSIEPGTNELKVTLE